MPRRTIRIALLAGGLIAAGAHAQGQQPASERHSLEAQVSQDAIQAFYIRDASISQVGTTEIAGGVFFNEDRDLIMMASAIADIGSPSSARRFNVRVGPRAYGAFLNGENEDIFGIALGGEARYYLGADRGSAIMLSAFYAPDILVFGSADNVTDVSLRFETRLRQDTTIFVGYRSFEFALPTVDRDVDDNVHIGFRHTF
jgi:hypothetical protein